MLKKISIFFVLIMFAAGLYFYPQLPDEMASHWNANGEVDDYMSKDTGTYLFPIIGLVIYVLFLILPKIDPLRENYKKFQKYYDMFMFMMLLFFTYIYGLTLAANLGYDFSMTVMMMPAMALLFYFIGVITENAKQNWFVGIKTPWTLSSERVWDKTHKLGGKIFKIFAFLFFIITFFPEYMMLLVGLLVGGSFGLVIYSYIEYEKEKKGV